MLHEGETPVPLRLVMMGTGEFALPTFLSLYDSPHQVVGLFTQPDRVGRGHHQHPHPMKEAALEYGTPVFQPERVNSPESLSDLRSLAADVCVVAAYGQILSAKLLGIPRLGAMNLHASLLPKYRGAAPVQYAVWKGEPETGVTIFKIEPRLDAGPILGVVKTAIGPKETAGELETRLAELAVPLTHYVLHQFETGEIHGTLQDASQVTRAPRLKKEDGLIDWTRTAVEIDCHIRAMQPWPNPYTFLQQSGRPPLRILVLDVEAAERESRAEPGTILQADQERLAVQAADAVVEIRRLRPEGKRAMVAGEFLRGHSLQVGDRFTTG
jgi:methionyl-tRNA formyltransferase